MQTPPESLKPEDFPVEADGACVKKRDGKPLANTDSAAISSEVADRLNAEEHRREEDRWSA